MVIKRWRIIGVLLFVALCFVLTTMSALAYDTSDSYRVYDDAGLLTDSEEKKLEETIQSIRENQKIDVVIVTINDNQGYSAMDYADNFLDNGGYGYGGARRDAILYLIDMDGREIWVSTQGESIYLNFSDARIDKMFDKLYDNVSNGDYYKSCQTFLEYTKDYMNEPVSEDGKIPLGLYAVMAFFGSLLIGGIVVLVMTVQRGGKVTTSARDYLVTSSVKVLGQQDRFTHRTVTTRRIPKNDGPSGGGGGGGGSSTHTSSGGVTHGGGGRKF